MKVRNRYGGTEYEVVEGLVVKDAQGVLHTVEKHAFEEVPTATDHWQDVTGECEVIQTCSDDSDIYHAGKMVVATVHDGAKDGYRLRKVQVPNHGSGMSSYFIVERKMSE